ncbi:1-acyl-sn-glycerol-3-phosphate acyltransferase [Clostridium fermenticellae]|uniref:1-acyl-sn-glycerol-3-phosphate acyltransferase n=1 Tax=Clostridium fermenticellae TaxID=2068654 RepID=A0A386H6S2_9CLOT|nr:lysophospholipid acyltransferase family protein [Clostridium fermenticellae]AYD41233.1 1-acyl-sn-glycerol-3-phosphate acyltransferase [Clostridium fermenticellae]
MISPIIVKAIGCLPDSFLRYTSRKILDRYMNKYADINVQGMENLKGVHRPILFICNHLSNSDALVIDRVLKDEDITFVAGVKLSSNSLTNLGMKITKTIGIKPNTADKDAISKVIRTLKENNNILIFPEGTRSRSGGMINGRRGVVLMQKLSKASIIPLGIYGSEKLLPIDDRDMALEKFHHAKVMLNIGKQIEVPSKMKGETKRDYEGRVLDLLMRSISGLLPEEYRGVYR